MKNTVIIDNEVVNIGDYIQVYSGVNNFATLEVFENQGVLMIDKEITVEKFISNVEFKYRLKRKPQVN